MRVKFLCYEGTMQTACLRLMGKKLLVALTMEGKFAGEGLQIIDEDDDMLSAMARELVERNGIGESADAVWKALNAEHQKLFPTDFCIGAGAESPELSGEVIQGRFRSSCACPGTDRFEFGLDLRTETGAWPETAGKAIRAGAGFTVRMNALTYQLRFGMHLFTVRVKLGLQRLLIFLAVRAMTSPLRLERHRRAVCAVGLDRDVSQPFVTAELASSWPHVPHLSIERIADLQALVHESTPVQAAAFAHP